MAALMLEYPVRGRWLVQNSPANRALSHGTRLFDTAHSIDLVPVNDRGRTAAFTPVSIFRPEPAERLPGSGRPILAPIKGTIIAVYDVAPDHHAHLGFPSVGYALTQGRRATGGWPGAGRKSCDHPGCRHRRAGVCRIVSPAPGQGPGGHRATGSGGRSAR